MGCRRRKRQQRRRTAAGVHALGRADVWHEFLGDPVTEFSSAIGFIPFTTDLGGSWGRLGIGGALELSESTTLYGNINHEHAFDGDAYAWDGKIGLKVKW